jgi:tetratricopeptide (TPR) repeat protein
MATTPGESGDREARLARAIAEYLEAERSGGEPDRRALIERYPDLRAELAAWFLEQDQGNAPTNSLGAAGSAAGGASAAATADFHAPLPETEVGPEGTALYARVDVSPTAQAPTLPEVGDAGRLPPGTRVGYVGDYELLSTIGHGGMGVVYEARQMSLNRVVALKMIRGGLFATDEEQRRFQNEAESAAALEHPNIVPILEVGEYEGRAYYSMMLVAGKNLAQRLAEYVADPKAAATLIAEVADAVAHAHQRGVLHRDLKPANILVDAEGHPHVADFGLAKRLGSESELTHTGQVLGTPAYMSPEQAAAHRGAVTTASDVYGLGALLFATLTGRAPFTSAIAAEVIRQVREEQPTRPTRLNGRVPRDLETICLKCLEKEPSRRYASAPALADDLRRWLRGEPVEARPVSAIVRAGMWCRRHPLPAALAAALAVAVVTGAAGVTWKWLEAEARGRELARANAGLDRERAVAVAVNEFLTQSLLSQANPAAFDRARKVTVEELLDRAAATIDERFDGPPEVEAAVRSTIGNTYHSLGRLDRAESQLRRALELRRGLSGESTAAETTALDLAAVLQATNRAADGLALADPAYRARQARLGASDADTLRALKTVAVCWHSLGRLDEAESGFRQALDGLTAALGPDEPETLAAAENLAAVLAKRGRYAEAEPPLRRVVEARRRTLRPDHPDMLQSLTSLAGVLIYQEKTAEADTVLTEVLGATRRVVGPEHESTLLALTNLSALLIARQKLDEAETLLRETTATFARTQPPDHPVALSALNNLAMVLLYRGKARDAILVLEDVLKRRRAAQGDDDAATFEAAFNLGSALLEDGRPVEAVARLEPTVPRYRKWKPGTSEFLTLLSVYGCALLDAGRPADALPVLREASEGRRKALPPTDWRLAVTDSHLGATLAALKRFEEAEPLLLAAEKVLASASAAPAARKAQARARLVTLYESWGKPDRAAPFREPRAAR